MAAGTATKLSDGPTLRPREPCPEPASVPLSRLALRRLHDTGTCRPCLYFTRMKDGCRRGDDCAYCHICDRAAAEARQSQLLLNDRRPRHGVERRRHMNKSVEQAGAEKEILAIWL
mmetsp:Transcript_128106/g.304144  ORF Transcript_128106/g.304144 Transcript_128106/m.304144 type:complete len:116 (+) Transcript_128106:56-403(+)